VGTLKTKIRRTTQVVATYHGDANTTSGSGKARIKVKIKRPAG
jgi:hypothetical protein